jgi:protocatechuate 3,4-dioxygenase beta subunit
MRKIIALLILVMGIMLPRAFAFEGGVFMDCKITPHMEAWHFPKKPFNTSANLLRKATKVRRAQGEYMLLKGKVLDRNCVPVQNAVIHIWQPDNNGYYEDSYPKPNRKDTNLAQGVDPYFGYTGTARTDNLGNFAFLTIFPGSLAKNAPHINYIIQHRDFEDLASKIYFFQHPLNDDDPDFKKLSQQEQQTVAARGKPMDPRGQFEGRTYEFIVTLSGENKYTRY